MSRPFGVHLVFFLAVLLSRMPFLFQGFGLDSDSWGVALAARTLHDRGVYEASRFPGFPIHEMLSSLTIAHGYFLTNLLVAVAGSLGILFFVLALRTMRFRYPLLAGAALAAVPVVYTSSVVTHDYVLALAFILAGFYYAVKGKPAAAGICLGLAIGCRITSGAMLLPFAILTAQNDGIAANARRILQLVAATIILGVFAFLPVISQYGFSFFTYEHVPYPPLSVVLSRMFTETWGIPGTLALGVGLVVLLLPQSKSSRRFLFPRSINEKHVVAWLIAIDLYIIAFLKLPSEPGYLIPLVPFVLLVFCKYLYDEAFIVFASLMILSPFVVSLVPVTMPGEGSVFVEGHSYRLRLLGGPVAEYESLRRRDMQNMDSLFVRLDRLHDLSLVVSGTRYNQLQFSKDIMLHNDKVTFVDYINPQSLARYFSNGYDIYYLPGAVEENKIRYGFSITDLYDATQLPY